MNQEGLQDMLGDSAGSMRNSIPEAGGARGFKYVLRQTFHYDYAAPVSGLRQKLIAIPPEQHGDQRRMFHQLSVSPQGVAPEWSHDRFGNLLATVILPTVTSSVSFSVEAILERDHTRREAVLPSRGVEEAVYLKPTRLTEAGESLTGFARQVQHGASSDIEAAERICEAVYRRLPYRKGVTSVSTSAMEALEIGAGVCQDHAHIMLAMCRAVGISARYISGHLLGEGSTHAWVEVLVTTKEKRAETSAFAFDPCYGRRPDATYLTIAAGRDYSDVPPTSGTYFGSVQNRLTSAASLSVDPLVG